MQLSENFQQIQNVTELVSSKNSSLPAGSSSAFDHILDNIMSDARQSSAVGSVNNFSDTTRTVAAGTGKLHSKSQKSALPSVPENKSSAVRENIRSSQNGKKVCDRKNGESETRVNKSESSRKELSENNVQNSAESTIKSANRINSDHGRVTAGKDLQSEKRSEFSEQISGRKDRIVPSEDCISQHGTEAEFADSSMTDSAENVTFYADHESVTYQNVWDAAVHTDMKPVEDNSVYQNDVHTDDMSTDLKESTPVVISAGYADSQVSSYGSYDQNFTGAQKMNSAEETGMRQETLKDVPYGTQRRIAPDFEKNIISAQSGAENTAYADDASEEISVFSSDAQFLKGEQPAGELAGRSETVPDRYSERVLPAASNVSSSAEADQDSDHEGKADAGDAGYRDQHLHGDPYASQISEAESFDREDLVYSDVKPEDVKRKYIGQEGNGRGEAKTENVSATKNVYDSTFKLNNPSLSHAETPETSVPAVKQSAENVIGQRSDVHRFANQTSGAVNTFSGENGYSQQNAEPVYQYADSADFVSGAPSAGTGFGRIMEDTPETSADETVNGAGIRSEAFRSTALQNNAMYREVNFYRRSDISEDELSEVSSALSGTSSDAEETGETARAGDSLSFPLKDRNSDNVGMQSTGFHTGNVMISSRSTVQSRASSDTAGIPLYMRSGVDSDYAENDDMPADMLPENAEFMNILKSSRDVSARVSQGGAVRLHPEIQNALSSSGQIRNEEMSSDTVSSVFNTDADAAARSSFAETLRSLAAGRTEAAAAAPASGSEEAGSLKQESEFVQTELSASNVVRQTGSSGFGENAGRNTDERSADHISQLHSVSGTHSGNSFKESLDAVHQLQKTVRISRNYEENARQIAENINIMLSKNVREAEINLDPTGLGKMKIVINMSDDAMARVSMVVQQNETRDLINDSMSRLRSMLEQQGIALEDSSVEQQNSWGDRSQNRGSSETKEFTSDKISHDNDDGTDFIAEGAGSAGVSEREVDYYA